MSIFPEFQPMALPEKQQPKVTGVKELAYDFEANEFILNDGKTVVVEGIEALKIWIEKTIRTARYRFPIYTSQHGCELEEIIGLDIPRQVVESEVQRVIREALIYDDRIEDAREFFVERSGDWLRINFRVITALGEDFAHEVRVVS